MSVAAAIPTIWSRWTAAAIQRLRGAPPRLIAALALAAAGFALGLALLVEHWGGFLPCSLCLLERWPYRVAIAAGVLGLMLPRPAVPVLLWLIVAAMIVDTGLALIHVGVEQHLWQNPISECAAPQFSGTSILERLLELSSRPPVPCDRATYLIPFVPLSMAAMNALYAAGCAGLLALYLVAREGPVRAQSPNL